MQVQARLKFANDHLGDSEEEWKKVMLSDETKLQPFATLDVFGGRRRKMIKNPRAPSQPWRTVPFCTKGTAPYWGKALNLLTLVIANCFGDVVEQFQCEVKLPQINSWIFWGFSPSLPEILKHVVGSLSISWHHLYYKRLLLVLNRDKYGMFTSLTYIVVFLHLLAAFIPSF